MFVETSAIVSILRDEPEKSELVVRIASATRRTTSVVNAVEAAIAFGKATSNYLAAQRAVVQVLLRLDIALRPFPRISMTTF